MLSFAKGLFKDIVESCLVLTTPEEVLLLALARIDGNLTIVPTSFLMSTDLIRMTCAVGTDEGRIFLGGDDGCVHEMVYEDQTMNGGYYSGLRNGDSIEAQLDQFYDGSKAIPDVLGPSPASTLSDTVWQLGKRSWQAVNLSAEDGPRKCRKLNRTSQASSIATALVPNAIRRATSVVFGVPGSQDGGRIVRLSVDSERQTLYSLSEKGWICVFDIGNSNSAPCIAACDVPKTARLYLEAVSRGQMFPPNSGASTVGFIHFPGGGAGAQAGVGGMEGARNILKQADWQRRMPPTQEAQHQSFRKSTGVTENHPMVTPVQMHVIPWQESSRLTLMAVTGGGLRLYFSALSSSVLSSGPVSLSNGNRVRSFGNKLTLCHIRSPPPLIMSNGSGVGGPSTWSADIAGGILPHISGSGAHVDATYYRDGHWVVAIQDSTEAAGRDIMIATTPDSAFRPREGNDGELVLDATGGLSESVSFPIPAIPGQGKGERSRVLSGGLVWEIDSDTREPSGVLQLLMRSPTPSDAELTGGLPQAYYPPSQIRQNTNPDLLPSTSRAVVPLSSSVRSQAIHVLTNFFFNSVLKRPLDHGLYRKHGPSLVDDLPTYRVSKRTGIKGFSLSAVERRRTPGTMQATGGGTKRSQTSNHTRATRLRQRVLRPPTQPLGRWTRQHLIKGNKIVTAINVQGLHKFEFDTVLSSLADALADAGDSVADSTRITSFFTGYGYKEGCAMCLALAIGCGPARVAAGNSQIFRNRAAKAALARAHKPRLSRENQQANSLPSSFSTSNATDNCVPIGYVFHPSSLSEGLCALVSRLIRPVWHKPLVVVTEGRSVKMRWGAGTKLTSAKVELLLDDESLEGILIPLQDLLSLVKTVFSRAIDVVPGTLGQQLFAMDIDGGTDQQQYFTQALQYHSQFRTTGGDSSAHLAPKDCDNIAHLLEERNIHAMYRLVTLVVQLLNVFSLLRTSEGIAGLPQTDWGLLHGVTVSELVLSAEGHDRLETLLNELIVATATSSSPSLLSTQADQLADQLAQQCYLYFSASSRFTYQGLRLANQALSHPPGSSQRTETGARAASQLIDAARYWQSASLISGRLVSGNGNENYFQVAERAIKYSSPLARAADLLIQLEDVSSVVDICLTTAQNFKSVKLSVGQKDAWRNSDMLAWEADLYHKHVFAGNPDPQTTADESQVSASSVYGTSVTAKDAIETCYAIVFVHLDELLRSNRKLLADSMVSACSAATDKFFLSSLFSFLLESSNTDTLLRINSSEAEAFLKKQNDMNLLCGYYSVQEKPEEAGRVALECARSNDATPLDRRIEWLARALQSFRAAQNVYRRPDFTTFDEELSKLVTETDDCLKIAKIQERVLNRIESLADFPENIDKKNYEKLKTSLFEVTPLFNDFVAVVPFYDLSLVILHMCRHDDAQVIRRLWKLALGQKVLPCVTGSPDAFQTLQQFAEDDLAEKVTLLSDTMEVAGKRVFENRTWVTPVHDMVVSLGRELCTNGADLTFPVVYILEQLEVLRSALGSGLTFGWPLTTLAEAGIPYLLILEAYETITHVVNSSTDESDPSKTLIHISASIELFLDWISNSQAAGQRAGQHNKARIELSRSMSTGDLMPKLNALRSRLEQIQAEDLLERLDSIEESVSHLVSMP